MASGGETSAQKREVQEKVLETHALGKVQRRGFKKKRLVKGRTF